MRTLEQFTCPKHPDRPSEDALFVGTHFVAVIDGATDVHGLPLDYDGVPTSPGRLAATILSAGLAAVDPDADAEAAIAFLTSRLEPIASRVPLEQRPTASAVIYSRRRNEVWSVGDCRWAHDGIEHAHAKHVDVVNAAMRALVTATYQSTLSAGELAATDPGREVILPLIRRQRRLSNKVGPFGFGVLDGTPVPAEYIEVFTLPRSGTLTLASDGYPYLDGTLAQAEERLAAALVNDPLCIGELQGTKALQPGANSFDDRTWVRIELTGDVPDPCVESASPGLVLAGRDYQVTYIDQVDQDYRPDQVRVQAAGTVRLPAPLAQAVAHANTVLDGTPEGSRFFDGGTWMFSCAPQIRDGFLTGTLSSLGYRAKSLARNTLPATARTLLEANWSPALPTPAQLPGTLLDTSPLRWPGAGIGFGVLCPDSEGRPTLLLHRRSAHLAVSPGQIGPAIGEGLADDDVSSGRLDVWAAACRGATEELGVTLAPEQIELVTLVRDDGSARAYNFMGVVHTTTPAHEWVRAYEDAVDGAEAAGAVLVPLTLAGVADLLAGAGTAGIASSVVALLVRLLERDDPDARHLLEVAIAARTRPGEHGDLSR